MKSSLFTLAASCLLALANSACTIAPATQPSPSQDVRGDKRTALEVQALVMKMADDYNAALGEAMQTIIASKQSSAEARTLAQQFLRNGMGSSLDIAAGPNPDAALLDLLVLTSLQRWAFETHWVPAGIAEPMAGAATARLRTAETELWHTASGVLSDAQQATLHGLIDTWIKANPERSLVSFVRFDEFVDIRHEQTLGTRTKAEGLFREVSEATATVDNARLLGERALWYAARYPSVVGQQAELSLYRIAEQPEMRTALQTLESLRKLGDSLATQVDSLDRDLSRQQERLFDRVTTERTATINQAKTAMTEVLQASLEDLEKRIATARDATVTLAFDRLAKERKELLADLESKEGQLHTLGAELRTTIDSSAGLAHQLTGTMQAIDRIVARFDREPGTGGKPLEIKDIRDAASEAAKAAEKLTALLEKTSQLADSPVWQEHITRMEHLSSGAIDRAFWRGLLLVAALVAGFAMIRLIPARPQA